MHTEILWELLLDGVVELDVELAAFDLLVPLLLEVRVLDVDHRDVAAR